LVIILFTVKLSIHLKNIIFFLFDNSDWGTANPEINVDLLDSVITDFYSNLHSRKIKTSPVMVLNSRSSIPPIDGPMIEKGSTHTSIYLDTEDSFWAQYAFQFSHELCHFVIDKEWPPINDRFGWLEEAICELASLYTLSKMSITWQVNPPRPNMSSFSVSLKKYCDDRISDPNRNITEPISVWLIGNLPVLYNDRYKRIENSIIAIHLLPIFTRTPDLWKIIHHMKEIDVHDNMTLRQYLLEWRKFIPSNLYSSFDTMMVLLLDN
jgi:hypothetical protein